MSKTKLRLSDKAVDEIKQSNSIGSLGSELPTFSAAFKVEIITKIFQMRQLCVNNLRQVMQEGNAPIT